MFAYGCHNFVVVVDPETVQVQLYYSLATMQQHWINKIIIIM